MRHTFSAIVMAMWMVWPRKDCHFPKTKKAVFHLDDYIFQGVYRAYAFLATVKNTGNG